MATRQAHKAAYRAARASSVPLAGADLAWLALLPCAVVAYGAMIVLGAPLGKMMAHAAPRDIWPILFQSLVVQPEPTEQGRYVVSLSAPLLVSGAVLLGLRHPPRLSARLTRALVQGCQLLLVAMMLVLLVVIQRLHTRFGSVFEPRTYFTWRTIALSAVFVVLMTIALRTPSWVEPLKRVVRETPARRTVAFMIAGLVTTAWLLTGVNTDGTIGLAKLVFEEIPQAFESTYSTLGGHGPLVGIHALYSNLLPYLAAGSMSVFGTSLGVYTVTMVSFTGAAMLAVYALLRRIVHNSLTALMLFLPFVATTFFMIKGTLVDREDLANLFSTFPERFAGPYVLAWLTARHLDRARPHHPTLLMFAAGFVVINDFTFGVVALGATLAALLWTREDLSPASIARLLGSVAAGVLGAAVTVAAMTLITQGSLPHFGWMLTYVRIYGSAGYALWPMPPLGIHLALYITYGAAIIVATLRAARGEEDRLLTGMLAWAGVNGLGTFAYYVGQTHPESLLVIFSQWALAAVLLTIVAVRAMLARPTHRPMLPELVVLFGFGLAACSLAQIPTPWGQIDRLGQTTASPIFTHNSLERFIDAGTKRGEHVLLLVRLPHRLAYDLGLVDVAPYPAGIQLMPLRSQLVESIERLHRTGGHAAFVWTSDLNPDVEKALVAAGFQAARSITDDSIQQQEGRYIELRDDLPAKSAAQRRQR